MEVNGVLDSVDDTCPECPSHRARRSLPGADVGASTAAMRARRGPLRASWERTPRSLLIVIPARSYPMGKFFLAVVIVSLAIIIAIAVFAVML